MTAREALQDALAAEHAAVWIYGLLAAQTSQSTSADLFARLDEAYVVHRDGRDELTALLRDDGVEPVAALPAYDVGGDLGDDTRVEATALRLERACTEVYAALVENSSGERRRLAVEVLNRTAVRELVFRGTPEMLPGSDEYADR